MPSTALRAWRDERAVRLDELLATHTTVSRPAPGRRQRTEQLNWSLVLRLAAEFQGFARNLHSNAAEWFSDMTAPENDRVRHVVFGLLTSGRHLDRGNAQPAALGSDFGRFGIDLWPTLRSQEPRAETWRVELGRLNTARNAIAHDVPPDLDRLRGEGRPMTLATFRRWRKALNRLATAIDGAMSVHLALTFRVQRPW